MQPENLISAVLMKFINWFLGAESIFDPNVAFVGHETVWASNISISQFSSLSTRDGNSEAPIAQSALGLECWGCGSNHLETGANWT